MFDLVCLHDHVFEAWFGSTADFEAQAARRLVACPICDSDEVRKAAMAPAVAAKGNRTATPAMAKAALAELVQAQRALEASADYVGADFASAARAQHDGDAPERAIYGEATLAEAAALAEDGIAVAPLPFATRRRNAN